MERNEILSLLETVPTPISQIEVDLGMPKTTLQKAVKGERALPKKWSLKLLDAYGKKDILPIYEAPPDVPIEKELPKEEPKKLSIREQIEMKKLNFNTKK